MQHVTPVGMPMALVQTHDDPVYHWIRWVFICPELAGQITVLLVLQQRLHVWTW